MALKDTIKKWLNLDPSMGYTDNRMYGVGYVGWNALNATTNYYQNSYENGFASIRVIASRFARIEPYTIDKTGKSVASNVLDRLYTPNNQMSAYDFREALAVMSLVHNKVYVRPHFKSIRKTADSLTGFTILENITEHVLEGELQYWLPDGTKLGTDEVIVLKSINPYNLHDGFSPAFAARRWTSIDDYIAEYQAGFFRNGAVPSGQFVITAKTAQEFNDIASKIKQSHQGAGSNNNVMFVHRPTDATGKPVEAQVEWVPFSVQNRELALKELFEQANKKIDSAYGVPASLRGVNDGNTYASVRVDTQIFYENTLEPFALKIWGKMTHELNRITGGTGVAISFDIKVPQVADEEKVRAEAHKVKAETITALMPSFELASIAAYVTSGNVKDLIERPEKVEEPDVLSSEEATDTPDQPIQPTSTASKAVEPTEGMDIEAALIKAVRGRMRAQIAAASQLIGKAVSEDKPLEDTEDMLLTAAILGVLLPYIAVTGAQERDSHISYLNMQYGIDATGTERFVMTGAQEAQYRQYVQTIASGYNEQTADKIRNVLATSREQGLSSGDTRSLLNGLLDEDYRVERLARTETQLAGSEASVWSMENIADELQIDVYKVWRANGNDPCEICRALVGRRVSVKEPFFKLGDELIGDAGGVMTNNWKDADTAQAHANCKCSEVYEVERS